MQLKLHLSLSLHTSQNILKLNHNTHTHTYVGRHLWGGYGGYGDSERVVMTQLVTAHVAVSSRVHTSWVFTRLCTPHEECVQPDGASVVMACLRWWVCARYLRGWVLLPDARVWVAALSLAIHPELSDGIRTHTFPKPRGSSAKGLLNWPPLTVVCYCNVTCLCMV